MKRFYPDLKRFCLIQIANEWFLKQLKKWPDSFQIEIKSSLKPNRLIIER